MTGAARDRHRATNGCLLYYITDRNGFPGDASAQRRRLLGKIAEAARAGVDYIQLREKDLSARELDSLAIQAVRAIREACHLPSVPRPRITALLINSRSDIALSVEADGVHLRSDDIPPQMIREIWAKTRVGTASPEVSPLRPLVGISCHSPVEVIRAADNGVTFALFGPVFEKGLSEPTGLALLYEVCKANIPVLALGGVTLANSRSCLEAGAAGVAGIRLFQENDVEAVVKNLRGRTAI